MALHHYETFYEMIKPAEERSEEVFAWFSEAPYFLFNTIMHLSCDNVAENVDRLIAKTPEGNSISFWLHPENRAIGLAEILRERGFGPVVTCPLMYWKVVEIEKEAVDIRQADIGPFLEILCSVYQLDGKTKEETLKVLSRLRGENYLIYEGEIPVGTATLLVSGDVGGIFNDATLTDRREASAPLMRFLMRRCRELNLRELIVLSSPEAEPLYTQLGFQKEFDIEIFAR